MFATATSARAADVTTTPLAGGSLLHRTTGTQDLWVLHVDLCTAGIDVRVTAPGEKGRTVSSFAQLVGAAAAVNGDFFTAGFVPNGPARHAGTTWGSSDGGYVAPVSFGAGFVDIPHHGGTSGPIADAREVVSGHPTILDDGVEVGNPNDPPCTQRNPRTSLGVSRDHRTLIVAVVDRRQTGAAGTTCSEEATLMNAQDAIVRRRRRRRVQRFERKVSPAAP